MGGSDPRAVEVAEEGVGDDMDEDPGADEPVEETLEEVADEDTEDGSLFIRSILPPACA